MNPRDVKQLNKIVWTPHGGSTYISQPIKVADFRDIGLTLVGTGTITVLGTKQKNASDTPPDFTASSTIDNAFAAIVIADETTPNTYATSIAVSSSTKLAEVNTNLMTYIALTRSVGTVDAYLTVCDNS